MTIIFLGLLSPISSSDLPTGEYEQYSLALFWSCSRWGLHSHHVTMMLVSSYLAVPSLPLLAVYFCCTFLKITLTRRYLAPCSVELRLSSRRFLCPRLSGLLTIKLTMLVYHIKNLLSKEFIIISNNINIFLKKFI